MFLYSTVITHIFSLFPISVCFYSYRHYGDGESLFLFFNYIFITVFSIFYHTYDYDNIKLNISSYGTWVLLDHIAASTIIIVTSLYTLRYKSPEIYLLSYIFKSIVICCYMLLSPVFNYWIYIIVSILILVRYEIVLNYIKNHYIISILILMSLIAAIIFYNIALNYDYNFYHSLWHVFVFMTAGFCCLIKNIMNHHLIEETNYNRTQSLSI
jgi:hypothetical protein